MASGRISQSAIERVSRIATDGETSFGLTAVGLGILEERELAEAYSQYLGIRIATRDDFPESAVMGGVLNPFFLRANHAVPLSINASTISVAMADPMDTTTIKAIAFAAERQVDTLVAPLGDLEALLDRIYPTTPIELPFENEAGLEELTAGDLDRLQDSSSDAPIIRLVNKIIVRAVEEQASDIHFEPTIDGMTVRFRVDGALRHIAAPQLPLRDAIISRLKIMGSLNIAERRLAQDGRMNLAVRGRDIDFRISTMPVLHGESVVLRILDRAGLTLELPALGFSGSTLDAWLNAIRRTKGIVLITGPTGSGKTTTLYATVLTIASEVRKVLTIEDPIEYQLPMINQTQIRPALNFTFANALRWALRHDPDVMMVGEIRDLETARIAVQAALTGHLILSTLHTNDAASALTRLLDLGIETYLLTSTVNAVAAQRLVRNLCARCRTTEAVLPEMIASFGIKTAITHIPVGCSACGGSGFRGRTALVEVLPLSAGIKQAILRRGDADEIRAIAIAEGMRTIRQHGLELVETGVTSLEEVLLASEPS